MIKSMRLFIVFCLCVIAGCSTDSQPASPLQVKVVDWLGKAVANATVVVGNQAGAMEAVSSTDDRGETEFNSVPANATVTAAIKCISSSSNRTYYYLDISYGVNVQAIVLTLVNCADSEQLVNVAVTETVAGIISREVRTCAEISVATYFFRLGRIV